MNSDNFTINSEIDSWYFTVPLSLSAHSQAEKFRQYHSHPQKAKQVYLNTLAVYAVNLYLQCRGFETNWQKSDSYNPVMQMLVDTADLIVQNRGKLECRPVLPDAEYMTIPVEVWQERTAYVAVKLSESLREATLLGFVQEVNSEKLPLRQLLSLSELPRVLNAVKPAVKLSEWFANIFEAGWETLDALLIESTPLALSFRNTSEVKRCKLIEFGTTYQSVVIIIAISSTSNNEIDISVEAQPPKGKNYLPSNMQLIVLDENGETVIDAYARNENKNIQLEFTGELGDRFSIKLVLEEISITETFVI